MKAVWGWCPCPERALKMTLVVGNWPGEGAHADEGFLVPLCVLIPNDPPVPSRFFRFLDCNPASLLPGPEPPSSDCEPERGAPRDPGRPPHTPSLGGTVTVGGSEDGPPTTTTTTHHRKAQTSGKENSLRGQGLHFDP